MKHYSLVFVFLISSLFLFYGCLKDKYEPPATDTGKQYGELRDYIYFKVGTYWIYEDSRGNMDSMYVTDSDEGTQNGVKYLTTIVHSSFDTYDYYVTYNSSFNSQNPIREKAFLAKGKPGDYVGQTILFEFPPIIGNHLYHNNGNIITVINYFVDFNLDSLNFKSVIEMNETVDITNPYKQPTNYFIGKNIGVIREELLDSNNVWKLKRYSIIQ